MKWNLAFPLSLSDVLSNVLSEGFYVLLCAFKQLKKTDSE